MFFVIEDWNCYCFTFSPRNISIFNVVTVHAKKRKMFFDFTGFRVFRARLGTAIFLSANALRYTSAKKVWRLFTISLFRVDCDAFARFSYIYIFDIFILEIEKFFFVFTAHNTCLSIGKVDVDAIGISTFLFAFSNIFNQKSFRTHSLLRSYSIYFVEWRVSVHWNSGLTPQLFCVFLPFSFIFVTFARGRG